MSKGPYVDIKYTMWERFYIDDKYSVDDIVNRINEDNLYDITYWNESIPDTSERLSIEDNDGNSTIEVFSEECNMVWDNKNGFVTKDGGK